MGIVLQLQLTTWNFWWKNTLRNVKINLNMRHIFKNIFKITSKLFETIIQLLSILLFRKYKYARNLTSVKIANQILILGNGPSIKREIPKIESLISREKSKLFCVNSFANSEYFEQLEPDHYVIVDPVFFKETPNNYKINILRNTLSINIKEKTKWPLSIYIPRYYLKSKFISIISSNKKIHIIPINNVPLSGGFESVKHLLFNTKLGNPVFRNVLIAAIFIGIQHKCKNIFLFGADHSWFKNIMVLNNNNIILDDQHLENTDEDKIVLTSEAGNPIKLHDFIKQMYITFREYHVLKEYAKYKKIKILNMTKDSFIDAFKKIEYDENNLF